MKNKDIRDYLNDMLLSAVIRKLEIIGEAIKKIPIDVRERYNNIPWKNIAGARG